MLVDRFDLSDEEELRAEVIEDDGWPWVRLWVCRKKKEADAVPTSEGLKIPLALFDRLKEAVLAVDEALAAREIEGRSEGPPRPVSERRVHFAHPSEEELAGLLDFYQIRWLYEPRSFPIDWDAEGNVAESFTPDFYLPEQDLYLELTTMKQNLVTKKNKKVRRLKELYPEVNIKVFYGRDYRKLLVKYGIGKGE